jgi:hypothetical protein
MFKASTGSVNKASGKTPAKDDSVPPPVRRACKLMLFGAGGTIVYGIFWIIVALTSRGDWIKHYETAAHESASQASSGFDAALVFSLAICLAGAAIWWWMSRVSRTAGLVWPRWASSVLLLLWTYVTYQSISAADTVIGLIDLIIMLIIWGIGGAAIYQLWLPESSTFIRSAGTVSKSR